MWLMHQKIQKLRSLHLLYFAREKALTETRHPVQNILLFHHNILYYFHLFHKTSLRLGGRDSTSNHLPSFV